MRSKTHTPSGGQSNSFENVHTYFMFIVTLNRGRECNMGRVWLTIC